MDNFIAFLRDNPLGTLFAFSMFLLCVEKIMVAFANRNKPTVLCDCDNEGEDEDDLEDEESKHE